MASAVDIANLALSHLGDDASVASLDPPEGSAQAQHCAQWYPTARDVLLQMHGWNFASRRAVPAQVSFAEGLYGDYLYAYRLPSECLRVLAVYPEGYTDDDKDGIEFIIESDDAGQLVLSKDEVAVIRYVRRVTDTARFPPLFVDALSRLLASYLAGPILKGDTGREAATVQYATFRSQFAAAAVADANQRRKRPDHRPEWIDARA